MIRSTFFGFNTALSGLSSSQKWLDITGQNLTNLHTEGYTRQRLDVYSSISGNGFDRYSMGQNNAVGNGVIMNGVSQLRDPFLDIQFRLEAANLGTIDSQLAAMKDLSSTFDESLVDGLDKQIQDFISQLQQLSANTGSKEFDAIVKSSANALTNLLNRYANQVDTVRQQQETQLQDIDVTNVNSILKKISDLNYNIRQSDLMGNPGLELRDQRNLLLDELSTYMKIDVQYSNEQISSALSIENMTVYYKGANGEKIPLIDNDSYSEMKVNSHVASSPGLSITDATGTTISSDFNMGFEEGDLSAINKSLERLASIKVEYDAETDADKKKALLDERTLLLSDLKQFNGISVDDTTDPTNPTVHFKAEGTTYTLFDGTTGGTLATASSKELDTQNTLMSSDVDTLNSYLKQIAELNAKGTPNLTTEQFNQRQTLIDKIKELSPDLEITGDADVDPSTLTITLKSKDGVPANDLSLLEGSDYNTIKKSSLALNLDTPLLSDDKVKSVNEILNKINKLNADIVAAAGDPDQLASLTDIRDKVTGNLQNLLADGLNIDPATVTVVPAADGQVQTIQVGGKTLFDNTKADPVNEVSSDTFKGNQDLADIDSGILKGRLDMLNKAGAYDGGGETFRGIGYYEKSLDVLANTFAKLFNDVNDPEDPSSPDKKNPLFAAKGDPTGKITAKNITIATGWANGDYGVTASKNEDLGAGDANQDGKNDNIMKMISLFSSDITFTTGTNGAGSSLFTGTLQGFLGNTINHLDVDTNATVALVKAHVSVLNGIDNSRANISGVSLDEEGINLLKFQKSYNAAARLMTTLDEALDTIISKMGTVGR